MKLILAIVSNEDSSDVMSTLIKAKFMVTKLATTGGFLKAGNTTLMIGVKEEKVKEVLGIIESCCKSRKEVVPVMGVNENSLFSSQTIDVSVGGATVFVVDVEQFIKM